MTLPELNVALIIILLQPVVGIKEAEDEKPLRQAIGLSSPSD